MTRKTDLVLTGLVVLAALLAAGLFPAAPASAQSGGGGGRPVTDDDVNRVAKQLYCPVCPNTPLDVCQTQACADWRAQIRDQLSQGWTDQQVIDYFVTQYGERVLAEPGRKGFTSLVWILPVVAVLIGLAVVWQVLRSWRRGRRPAPAAAASPPAPGVDAETLARIEQELQELR